jgi:methionyl-tRNA formyltransferase
MKIVMFGTGPFAVPTFLALLDSKHEVLALVTRPIEDAGRRRKSAANPMRDVAEARGLTIHDPLDANADEFVETLRELQADLFVVCDFGQILSNDCLAAAALGGINLHGSLLPRYRGAAPINWAVYHGEAETGVSVIHMTPKLDGGPILTSDRLSIHDDDTSETLEPKLSQLGVAPVMRAVEMLEAWDGHATLGAIQDPGLATRARRLRKEDGWIRWARTAEQIVNQVRALQPWPGAFTEWHREGGPALRLIVNQLRVHQTGAATAGLVAGQPPGTVVGRDDRSLMVQAGSGTVELLVVQPAGKKSMPIDAFLRGYPIAVGQRLRSPQ